MGLTLRRASVLVEFIVTFALSRRVEKSKNTSCLVVLLIQAVKQYFHKYKCT